MSWLEERRCRGKGLRGGHRGKSFHEEDFRQACECDSSRVLSSILISGESRREREEKETESPWTTRGSFFSVLPGALFSGLPGAPFSLYYQGRLFLWTTRGAFSSGLPGAPFPLDYQGRLFLWTTRGAFLWTTRGTCEAVTEERASTRKIFARPASVFPVVR